MMATAAAGTRSLDVIGVDGPVPEPATLGWQHLMSLANDSQPVTWPGDEALCWNTDGQSRTQAPPRPKATHDGPDGSTDGLLPLPEPPALELAQQRTSLGSEPQPLAPSALLNS